MEITEPQILSLGYEKGTEQDGAIEYFIQDEKLSRSIYIWRMPDDKLIWEYDNEGYFSECKLIFKSFEHLQMLTIALFSYKYNPID